MPTIVPAPGQAPITFTHPSELRDKSSAAIPIPRQAIAEWPALLAKFVAICSAATSTGPAAFGPAVALLHANHVSARLADVPEAKREAFRTYLREHVATTAREGLVGPEWCLS